ncbi:hypothetical protein BaRGS_00001643, partial [Batillaria attramentaria]
YPPSRKLQLGAVFPQDLQRSIKRIEMPYHAHAVRGYISRTVPTQSGRVAVCVSQLYTDHKDEPIQLSLRMRWPCKRHVL